MNGGGLRIRRPWHQQPQDSLYETIFQHLTPLAHPVMELRLLQDLLLLLEALQQDDDELLLELLQQVESLLSQQLLDDLQQLSED